MADALTFAVQTSSKTSNILQRLSLKPKQYLLATVHRAENTDDPQRLAGIMDALSEIAKRETVVLPMHPRTKKIMTLVESKRSDARNVSEIIPGAKRRGITLHPSLKIIDPVGYFDIIALEKSARMILTDSGGIQKEAYWLKVPCVTLRDETEWLETVDNGWNILTGANSAKIIKAVKTFKTPAKHPPLYGNGKATEKCLKTLLKYKST
jgi:UDP-N-acetylglucosamine 2-epimerase (non-hydrolysing)/UDP-GlcNAc3NAcA epimerase